MTQEELLKNISKMLQKDQTYWEVTAMRDFINQHVKEVIGEDEEFKYPNDGGTYVVIESLRNELKEEQRKRAGL